jgi:hypothetical protein
MRDNLLTGEEGAKSYDGEKALSSINHSVLSVSCCLREQCSKAILRAYGAFILEIEEAKEPHQWWTDTISCTLSPTKEEK